MDTKKLILFIGIGFALFLGVTTWLMMGNRKNRVEVCMGFQGRQACKTASGESREASLRTATDTACALVASGVTDTQACTRGEPLSVRWLD